MRKINSKQTGHGVLSSGQTFVSIAMVLVWIGTIIALYVVGLNMHAILLVMVLLGGAIGAIFFIFVLDKNRFDRIIIYYKFMVRLYKGKTTIYAFVLPLKQLKKHIPIENIHEDGLIQYSKRQYGVLFRYDPPNVPSSELERFHERIEYVVNSFGHGIEASFHFYDMIDRTNSLGNGLLKAMNDENKTLQQKQHLYGMYKEVTQTTEPKVSTEFLMAIKLGKFKSPEHASKAYKSTMPGILKALRERGIYSMQVIGESDVAIEFKKFAVMEGY